MESPLKLADDKGLYLLVKPSGATGDRDKARKPLAAGSDPMADRKVDKLIRVTASGNSFQSVALEWHKGQSVRWAPVTTFKTLKHMEADLFPVIGHRLVSEVTPPELLAALRRVQDVQRAYAMDDGRWHWLAWQRDIAPDNHVDRVAGARMRCSRSPSCRSRRGTSRQPWSRRTRGGEASCGRCPRGVNRVALCAIVTPSTLPV